MMQCRDLTAVDVVSFSVVCEGDKTLEDLGITELRPGQFIIKCNKIDYKTTCHNTELGPKYFQCSECREWDFENKHPNYCWHCGRKVVDN